MHRFVLLLDLLLAGVMFCCLGVLLSLFLPLAGSGSEGPYALGIANEAHGNAPLLDGNYLVTPAQEAEKVDNSPVNAGLLTMLLLAASFVGASVGWLLAEAQGQGALCFSSLGVVGRVLGRAREEFLPFLGVFCGCKELPARLRAEQGIDCILRNTRSYIGFFPDGGMMAIVLSQSAHATVKRMQSHPSGMTLASTGLLWHIGIGLVEPGGLLPVCLGGVQVE